MALFHSLLWGFGPRVPTVISKGSLFGDLASAPLPGHIINSEKTGGCPGSQLEPYGEHTRISLGNRVSIQDV